MDWTDVHYRQLARLISKHTWLWTEMVVDTTVVHAQDLRRFLWFPPEQHPIVLQLGGSDPEQLGRAAKIAGTFRYDEINLNCGCPSDRVAGAGCFGASLMLQPGLVADCMAAVAANVSAPTTVKCRLGVDDVDSYPDLCNFIHTVSQGSPVRHFIVHSRKCHLKGLNPHQNRTIPPLRYEWVFALKRDFPHLNFSLNGGIQSCYDARSALQHSVDGCQLHGVMIGRAAYHRPWQCLGEADTVVFGGDRNAATCRRQVLEAYAQYADAMVGSWEVKPDGWRNPSVRTMTVPLLNLFHGERGSKKWKQALDSRFRTATSVSQLLHDTLHLLPDAVLDAPPGPPTDNAAFATAPSLPPAPASLQLLRVHPAAAERVEESLRVKRRKEEEKMERRAARRQQVEKNAPGTASQNGTPATGASAPTAVTACNGGTTPSASPPSPSFPAASPLGMNPDPACPLGIAEPVAAGGGVIL